MAGTITYKALSESPMSVGETDLRSATVTVKYVATWQLDVKVYVNGTPRDVTMVFEQTTLWQVNLSDTIADRSPGPLAALAGATRRRPDP